MIYHAFMCRIGNPTTVYVIDPATLKVIDKFKVGINPQHVVPSWDLKTLWVANNAEHRTDGSLTPIDPKTGKAGARDRRRGSLQHVFHARRPFGNIVAEALKRLDFRDPQTMAMQSSIANTPGAAASITPTSRSMAATRSSRANSRDRWSRSILVGKESAELHPVGQAGVQTRAKKVGGRDDMASTGRKACRRIFASRLTASCFLWPT
jgi:DNA-binding beta-propeller fold protein YncE